MLDEENVPRLFPSFTQDNYHPSEVLASLGVVMPVTESLFSNILHGLCILYVLIIRVLLFVLQGIKQMKPEPKIQSIVTKPDQSLQPVSYQALRNLRCYNNKTEWSIARALI